MYTYEGGYLSVCLRYVCCLSVCIYVYTYAEAMPSKTTVAAYVSIRQHTSAYVDGVRACGSYAVQDNSAAASAYVLEEL